jgi:RimJ/RimL family protein N-acetyltransferase
VVRNWQDGWRVSYPPRSLRPQYPVRSDGCCCARWPPVTLTGYSPTVAARRLAADLVLFWRSRPHAGGELGYVFHPGFGGRGYATEAANATSRLGFDGLGQHRIIARIDERNEPSVQLARRLGMWQEGRLVRNEFFKGEWSTELDFALLADE